LRGQLERKRKDNAVKEGKGKLGKLLVIKGLKKLKKKE